MSKDITVGEFLEETKDMTIDETQEFYDNNVVSNTMEIEDPTVNSFVEGEEVPVPAAPPGLYELSDDEFDIIQGLILSARVQGEKFPEGLMDKFGVTQILDRYVDILKGKQPND